MGGRYVELVLCVRLVLVLYISYGGSRRGARYGGRNGNKRNSTFAACMRVSVGGRDPYFGPQGRGRFMCCGGSGVGGGFRVVGRGLCARRRCMLTRGGMLSGFS